VIVQYPIEEEKGSVGSSSLHAKHYHFLIDNKQPDVYTSLYIRPMAVSHLNHPEGVPIPWGFFFSD